jgi:site-specific recombinase XerD
MKNALPQSAVNFLEQLHTNNKAKTTINGYESDLRVFVEFLKDYKKKKEITDRTIKVLKLDDLNKFINYTKTKTKKNSECARARKVACLRSYYKYLKKIGFVDSNIAEDLDSPKIGKKIPIAFTDQQVEKIYNALSHGDLYYHRNKCIVTLLFNTGVRVSELINIKLNDIQDNKLFVLRKGNKEDCIYLNKKCLEVIKEYMEYRIVDDVDEENQKYLFISKMKRKMDKSSVELIMKNLYKRAGLTDKKYVTHTTRHTVGTNVYRKTKDILSVANVLGHENVNTSRIYITIDEERMKDIMEDL